MQNLQRILQQSLWLFIICAFPWSSLAAMETEKRFEDITVHYSVFNSEFIKPDIAKIYGIVRGKYHGLVNIAIIDNQTPISAGIKASVTGHVANLMSQKKPLAFIEIQEQDATYYLAKFRFSHEEVLRFTIEVTANENKRTLTFTRKMHVNDRGLPD